MKFTPHEYQSYAIRFIEEHEVSAVMLDMGLGKTAITLTAINDLLFDSFDAHKVLIIGPLRVARDTWPDEIRKWDHLRDIRYSVAIGTESERIQALRAKADIYIINRENVEWLIEKSRLPFDYDMVVIDELSSFKSHKAKRFRSLMKARPKVRRIVGLTGTPASNGLMDLWAEYRVLDMGERLGRFITRYREAYFAPDKTNGQVVFSYKPLPYAEREIYSRISDITISMKGTDYLKMPELISNEYRVRMDDAEKARYDAFRASLVLSLGDDREITAANAASLTGRLSQLANGAIYDEDGNTEEFHSRKLDALEDLIESANGRPVLVAYWFRHDLERIMKRLDAMNADHACLSSRESIRKWNEGRLQVGLIHPASAGHGLNLQSGGSTIIWFGLTWSLELYQQTNARLWRQGQKSGTVVIEHIITEGTVDETIMEALKKKELTQSALIDAVRAELHGRRRG
jgi:SNF2 family DNA or RNA helicase